MRPKDLQLRFAVGTPDGPRSGIWRLWTARPPKSDIYLSARAVAGGMKVSLHESGSWQVSFTQQLAKRLQEQGTWRCDSRHIERWKRPTGIVPGMTLALRLAFPSSELRVIPMDLKPGKAIQWIDPPQASSYVEIVLLLTKPGIQVLGWPGKRSMGTALLAEHLLPSDDTLWVVYRCCEHADQLLGSLEAARREIASRAPDLATGSIGPTHASTRLLLLGAMPDSSRYFVEVAADALAVQQVGSFLKGQG